MLAPLISCKEETATAKSLYRYIEPAYNLRLKGTTDTLHFLLNDSSYNEIESSNVFENGEEEYISFFDRRSANLLIYKSTTPEIFFRIPLKRFLKDQKLKKTNVYVKNFDSIIITNKTSLYLFDSAGVKKRVFRFLTDPPNVNALLDNDNPPVIVGQKLYTGIRPSIFDESTRAYRNWKTLYEFDFQKDSVALLYNLPPIYHSHVYGYQYLYNSFCLNSNDKFVFSFAADTNIYETDLKGYHMAYYGKSKYQEEPIVWTRDTKDDKEGYENFITHQAYGPIYFDPHKLRYLRVAWRKISETDYEAKSKAREQYVIIFDQNFKIIGESQIDKGVGLSTLFFTKNGKIYARVNRQDENALHFVMLAYDSNKVTSPKLAEKYSYNAKP